MQLKKKKHLLSRTMPTFFHKNTFMFYHFSLNAIPHISFYAVPLLYFME